MKPTLPCPYCGQPMTAKMKLSDGQLDGWKCGAVPWCTGLYGTGERARALYHERVQIARQQV